MIIGCGDETLVALRNVSPQKHVISNECVTLMLVSISLFKDVITQTIGIVIARLMEFFYIFWRRLIESAHKKQGASIHYGIVLLSL